MEAVKVFLCGGKGSGKTVYLSALYKWLSVPDDAIGLRCETSYVARNRLSRIYNRLGQQWPKGTVIDEHHEIPFEFYVDTPRGGSFLGVRTVFFDYSGEAVTGEAKDAFTKDRMAEIGELADTCDVVFSVLDGELVYQSLVENEGEGRPFRIYEGILLPERGVEKHLAQEHLDAAREAMQPTLDAFWGQTSWSDEQSASSLELDLSAIIGSTPLRIVERRVHGVAGAMLETPDERLLAFTSALGEPMAADLLVLAGCISTAQSDWLADGENSLVSLYRRAGVASVISTLWPVDDQATGLYTEALMAALAAGKSRAQAHGEAQQRVMGAALPMGRSQERLIHQPSVAADAVPAEPQMAFDHPYFWGAFTLAGAWR